MTNFSRGLRVEEVKGAETGGKKYLDAEESGLHIVLH